MTANLFAKFASAPTPGSRGGGSFPKAALAAFFAVMLEESVRMSYTAFARLVHAVQGRPGIRKNDGNTGSALVEHLDGVHQCLVCQAGGGYSQAAFDAWREAGIEAPEGLETWPVLENDSAVSAYNAFLAKLEEESEGEESEGEVSEEERT